MSFYGDGSPLSGWMRMALLDTASALGSFPQRFSKERLFGGSDIRQDTHQTSQPIAIFDALYTGQCFVSSTPSANHLDKR